MKTWTTTFDCPCSNKHTVYTIGEEIPSGHYVLKCGSLKVKIDAGAQGWSESADVPKGARKVVLNQ